MCPIEAVFREPRTNDKLFCIDSLGQCTSSRCKRHTATFPWCVQTSSVSDWQACSSTPFTLKTRYTDSLLASRRANLQQYSCRIQYTGRISGVRSIHLCSLGTRVLKMADFETRLVSSSMNHRPNNFLLSTSHVRSLSTNIYGCARPTYTVLDRPMVDSTMSGKAGHTNIYWCTHRHDPFALLRFYPRTVRDRRPLVRSTDAAAQRNFVSWVLLTPHPWTTAFA